MFQILAMAAGVASQGIFWNPLRRIDSATVAACCGCAIGSLVPLLRKEGHLFESLPGLVELQAERGPVLMASAHEDADNLVAFPGRFTSRACSLAG